MSVQSRAKTALDTASAVALLAACAVVVWRLGVEPSRATSLEPGRRPRIEDVTETIARMSLTNVVGDGPVAIVEFSDFQCPFCARHAQETFPALKRELIDSGEVRYAIVHLPLHAIHPQAIPAAEAAECAAEQGEFWNYHDVLFEKQSALPTADFTALAREIGLDGEAFERCLAADVAFARVQASQLEARRLGVNATPTLFIGRVRADGAVDLLKRFNGAGSVEMLRTEVAKMTDRS